jgi:hypothetical protein
MHALTGKSLEEITESAYKNALDVFNLKDIPINNNNNNNNN